MFASHIMNMKSESMKYTVKEKEKEWIRREVHHLYHDCDVNCASTMLHCLSILFSMPVSDDVFASALGMHGAGYYRAQCGLVEGTLMFIGLYGWKIGSSRDEIVSLSAMDLRRLSKKSSLRFAAGS